MMVIKNVYHITASTLITLKQIMVLNVNNSLLNLVTWSVISRTCVTNQ